MLVSIVLLLALKNAVAPDSPRSVASHENRRGAEQDHHLIESVHIALRLISTVVASQDDAALSGGDVLVSSPGRVPFTICARLLSRTQVAR